MDPVLAESSWSAFWSAPWAWAILLLLVGLAIAILEVFVPSGGVLGFLAVCSALAAIVVGFMDGRPWFGFTILTTALIGLPATVIVALKWWPRTPMGQRMLLGTPSDGDVLPDTPRQMGLKDLVGRVGVAKSEMLPSGAIRIDGRTIDAVTEGMPVDVGQQVRVMEVHGNRVVVRPVDAESPSPAAGDPLRRPIDTVGSDPFEEPPG
jgi:membrane-bound serine protease (ClpP class)